MSTSKTGWTWESFRSAVIRHDANPLDHTMVWVIVLSGIIVGLETIPSLYLPNALLFHTIDSLILLLFTIEMLIKLACHGRTPWRYFKDGWNLFDFTILVLTALPVILVMGHSAIEAGIAMRSLRLIRSLRALRFMRLASEMSGIRVIIETLIRSLPQLGIVGVLLLCLNYTFAVIGYNLFHLNDPKHFGSLWQSMLTMFHCAVGEFAEVMYIQIDGSNFDPGYYESLLAHYSTVVPERFPVIGPIFFISFVFIAGLTILNFFVGTILSELDNVRDEERQQSSVIVQLQERFDRLEELIIQRTNRGEG